MMAGACGSVTLKPAGAGQGIITLPSGKCVFGGWARAQGHASQSYSPQLCQFIAGGKFEVLER